MGSMWQQPELLLVGVREGKLRHREQLGAAVLPALCRGCGWGGLGVEGGGSDGFPPQPPSAQPRDPDVGSSRALMGTSCP